MEKKRDTARWRSDVGRRRGDTGERNGGDDSSWVDVNLAESKNEENPHSIVINRQ
jgi:hypothetical protein